MDHESLLRRAADSDVNAFMALTRTFQHFAFGPALAVVHDFQQAEDVVQEAFIAARSALPTLADPVVLFHRQHGRDTRRPGRSLTAC